MGRPKKTEKKKVTVKKIIPVRVTEREKTVIETGADIAGRTTSEFMRNIVMGEVEKDKK